MGLGEGLLSSHQVVYLSLLPCDLYFEDSLRYLLWRICSFRIAFYHLSLSTPDSRGYLWVYQRFRIGFYKISLSTSTTHSNMSYANHQPASPNFL
jgi:hypothetical protein